VELPKAAGRPGYNPSDLLKLYIYGYLNRVRSSRRLEAEDGGEPHYLSILPKKTLTFINMKRRLSDCVWCLRRRNSLIFSVMIFNDTELVKDANT